MEYSQWETLHRVFTQYIDVLICDKSKFWGSFHILNRQVDAYIYSWFLMFKRSCSEIYELPKRLAIRHASSLSNWNLLEGKQSLYKLKKLTSLVGVELKICHPHMRLDLKIFNIYVTWSGEYVMFPYFRIFWKLELISCWCTWIHSAYLLPSMGFFHSKRSEVCLAIVTFPTIEASSTT
jgi:hypothetical protein